ncbi:MAG: DUF6600 domain-containing protein [Polyangiaceae bacterium]
MTARRGLCAAAAAICAAPVLTGCTVYTEPAVPASGPGERRPVHVVPPAPVEPAPVTAASIFHDELRRSGQWYDSPVCGGYYGAVWRPEARIAGATFVPYVTSGAWLATDLGWSFESDFDWGWATFHYGNWCDDGRLGWVWVPDVEWAPAWVQWRYGGGFVGWAPLPPPGIPISDRHWVFMPQDRFSGQRVTQFALSSRWVPTARHATRPVETVVRHDGYTWSPGPPPDLIPGETRPVHVVPPARGSVRRVTVRPRH